MMSAHAEIKQVIGDYLDGLHYADVDRLSNVFHPKAVYATADEAEPLIRTMSDYFVVVASRVSPASRNEPRKDAIDRIEVAGENTATARVRCRMGDRDFVDFLSLIRTSGEWRIISKTFQIIERTEGG
ncbi:MAG: nuclear transport factor 2 family protein [Pseudomonadota bacterium]